MCHANLGPDSSGTRFQLQLEHCSIPSQKVACMWLKWSFMIYSFLTYLYNNSSHLGKFIVYIAVSHIYFWRHKFSVQSIWSEERAPKSGTKKWSCFIASVSGACFMDISLSSAVQMQIWLINYLLTYSFLSPINYPHCLVSNSDGSTNPCCG